MRKIMYNVNGTIYNTLTEARANGYNPNYHEVVFETIVDEEQEKRSAEHRKVVEEVLANR